MRMTRTRDRLFMYYVAAFVLCIFSELIFADTKCFRYYNVWATFTKLQPFVAFTRNFCRIGQISLCRACDTNKRLDAEVLSENRPKRHY